MRDISSTLIPLLVGIALWINVLLPIAPRKRALLMAPFVLAACLFLFWEVNAPISGDSEFTLSLLANGFLIAACFLTFRKARVEYETRASATE